MIDYLIHYTIREAHPGDAPSIAKVHVDTWWAAYRDILPAGFLASLSYQITTEGWQKAFAELRTPKRPFSSPKARRRRSWASPAAARSATMIHIPG